MIKNYLKIAWRNLLKNKKFTIINLLGLSLGISVTLLLGTFVFFENTFDNFHENGSNIYRINSTLFLPDQQLDLSLTSGMVGPELKQKFSKVTDFVRVCPILIKNAK